MTMFAREYVPIPPVATSFNEFDFRMHFRANTNGLTHGNSSTFDLMNLAALGPESLPRLTSTSIPSSVLNYKTLTVIDKLSCSNVVLSTMESLLWK